MNIIRFNSILKQKLEIMMRFAFLIMLVLFNSGLIYSNQNDFKRILFIGNSYTFGYSMPKILQELIDESGDKAEVESIAVGGFYLKNHSQNENTINKIKEGNWDIIIIQEQSQMPALSDDVVENESYPYLFVLDSIINQYNFCAKKYFFMTWGRKIGDTANCANFPKLCTYQGMDRELRFRYLDYAQEIGANVVPAGVVWNFIRTNYPEIELYEPDGSHPSRAGAIANAYTFYSYLFDKNPNDMVDNDDLDTLTIRKIKFAVNKVKENFKMVNKPMFLTEINTNLQFSSDLINEYFPKFYDKSAFYDIQLNDSVRTFHIPSKCYKFDSTYSKKYYYENGTIIIDDYLRLSFNEEKTILNYEVFSKYDHSKLKLRIYTYDNFTLRTYNLGNLALNIDMKYFPKEFFIDLEDDDKLIEKLLIVQ